MSYAALIFVMLLPLARCQKYATLQPEIHPPMSWEICSASSCSKVNGSLAFDANWRWVHKYANNSYINCFTDGKWVEKDYPNGTLCSDDHNCTNLCAVDGSGYKEMGVKPVNGSITLKYVNRMDYSMFKGSRLFMMSPDDKYYQMFNLLNQEVSFEVDVSKLPCGISANLNFLAMDADGGIARYPENKAGARFGTGYCDATCGKNLRFVNGMANVRNWTTFPDFRSTDDAESGIGLRGSCCPQVEVFTGNSVSSSFGLHPCSLISQTQCLGDFCGGIDSPISVAKRSACDDDGCAFNSYRLGDSGYYGIGGKGVDTGKPFTVVTQFITTDGTDSGLLQEIKRFYIQNETKIPNSSSKIEGLSGDSITSTFCTKQKEAFEEGNMFDKFGGMAKMTEALKRGLVMSLGVWDDRRNGMLWLDGKLGEGKGAERGTCPTPALNPQDLVAQSGSASARFGKIRLGNIGRTV